VTAAIEAKSQHDDGCASSFCALTPEPQPDSEVMYIGDMAIYSASVQSLQVNADVIANTMISSDPDEIGVFRAKFATPVSSATKVQLFTTPNSTQIRPLCRALPLTDP
jgi:hypothetical protein